jgi:hypothetical protein
LRSFKVFSAELQIRIVAVKALPPQNWPIWP